MPVNIEIKAQCPDPTGVARILTEHQAEFKGTDHQVDTYFNVTDGRLKLREGKIENNLIYYKRADQAGPKRSDVILHPSGKDDSIKQILTEVLGVKVIVDKERDIYFIDNVKFHIDKVRNLGNFVEIEAIGKEGEEDTLDQQCKHFMELLHIKNEDLIVDSYSDLLLK
jgi:predicted adenylyl cyclase CyaB